jgi:hypothetical protein
MQGSACSMRTCIHWRMHTMPVPLQSHAYVYYAAMQLRM